MSLVESCPSTVTRSKERLTHTPSSRSAVSARQLARRSRTKHSIVAKRGEIMPAPLHWALRRTVPDGQLDLEVGALLEARRSSGSPAGSRRRRRASGARASRMPFSTASTAQVLADRAGRGERDLARRRRRAAAAAAPCVLAASSSPRRPVAALAQPELASTARSAVEPAALAGQEHRRGGGARGGEAGGADRAARRRTRAGPTSGLAARLQPGGDAGRAEPGGQPRVAGELAHVRRARHPARAEERLGVRRAHESPSPLGQAEHQVEVLDRLRGGALPEVVDRGEHEHLAGVLVGGGEQAAVVGRAHLAHAGRPSRRPRRTAPPRRRRRRARAAPRLPTSRVGVT